MKRLLLVGGGHAHLVVLRAFKAERLEGARVAVVSPRAKQLYSGMVPGLIAGHYRRHQAEVDVSRLADAAHAEFIEGEVTKLDAAERVATLQDGTELEYDLASLDVGSLVERSIPGADLALPAKPIEPFYEALRSAKLNRVAIAGGGAAGAELAMALRALGAAVTVFAGEPSHLPERAVPRMRAMGVDVRPGMAIGALEPGPVAVFGPGRQSFDLVILATGAAPPPWLKASGLECDERGFVLAQDTLQSVSHAEVFAAGDCASLASQRLPKSGVYAVRQGETLARNVRAAVKAEPLEPFRPQRDALVLLSCGRRYAIAQRGRWSFEGHWVWWWKDRIDKRWIRSLAV